MTSESPRCSSMEDSPLCILLGELQHFRSHTDVFRSVLTMPRILRTRSAGAIFAAHESSSTTCPPTHLSQLFHLSTVKTLVLHLATKFAPRPGNAETEGKNVAFVWVASHRGGLAARQTYHMIAVARTSIFPWEPPTPKIHGNKSWWRNARLRLFNLSQAFHSWRISLQSSSVVRTSALISHIAKSAATASALSHQCSKESRAFRFGAAQDGVLRKSAGPQYRCVDTQQLNTYRVK